jgi:hypothetical protein
MTELCPTDHNQVKVCSHGRAVLEQHRATGGTAPVGPLTPKQLLMQGYEYHAYCTGCLEWRQVDLRRFMQMGQGDRSLKGRPLVCRFCGEQGSGQARRAAARR